MPAWRLNGQGITVRKYNAVGFDSATTPQFITHLALSDEERQNMSLANNGVNVVHMMPPLRTSRGLPIQVIGSVQLGPDEQSQIGVFVEERKLEYRAQENRQARKPKREDQYIIDPPAKGPDPDKPYWRFSCAGFVIQAYLEAGIQLLVRDRSRLPKIPLEVLKQAYPASLASRLDNAGERAKYGLSDEGKKGWPVILAGYVINSLARDASVIQTTPYQPVRGDEFFPSQRAISLGWKSWLRKLVGRLQPLWFPRRRSTS